MFNDRKDAGRKLGAALQSYAKQRPLVLAIPRGGVEVGDEVARALDAEFSILICRKLPFPDNPEAGFGAIAEDGTVLILPEHEGALPPALVERIVREQRAEVKRRVAALRGGAPLPELRDRVIILVDDGIAMGSTMRVAAQACRNRRAAKIVVAAPVSGPGIERLFAGLADAVVVLHQPPWFRAVAEAYRNWYDVPDEEVLAILKRRGLDPGEAAAP